MGEPVRVMPGEVPRKSGNTCLIGCIGAIVLSCVLIFVLILAGFYAVGQIRDKFTSEAPEPLPTVEYSEEQARQVTQQVGEFEAALRAESPTPATIELSGPDLNVLLHADERFAAIADKVFLDIQGDTLTAQVSVPLDMLGMEGRWLNGAAAVDVDIVNDKFVFSIQQFSVRGMEIPPQAMAQFEGEFNNSMNQDPDVRALAARIQEITVKDGRVRITLEGGQP